MSKIETREQVVNPPKRVRIEMLVPYAIIWTLAIAGASLILGWNLRSENLNQVKAEAHALVETTRLKVDQPVSK
jgi:hypothetical protein